jgi:hypothetical protein
MEHIIENLYRKMLLEATQHFAANQPSPIKKQSNPVLRDLDNNIVAHTIKKFKPDYEFSQEHPGSSLTKQYVIGLANRLATSDNNDGYKAAVYKAYQEHHPEFVAGTANYDELVNKSYGALKKETESQFNSLPVSTTYHEGEHTYPSSAAMVNDVHQNHHMAVFSGGDPHTHLDKTPGEPLSANEKFRAVHDYFGHALEGNQFGPKGEEIAWNIHRQTFSPDAVPALTAETRGQNSEVNYSELNVDNIKKMKEHRELAEQAKTPEERAKHLGIVRETGNNWNYAKQKASILPPEMNSPDYNGSVPKSIEHLLHDKGSEMNNYNTKEDHLGIHKLAKLYHPDDAHSVTEKLAAVHGYKGIVTESTSYDMNSKQPLLDSDYAKIHQERPGR